MVLNPDGLQSNSDEQEYDKAMRAWYAVFLSWYRGMKTYCCTGSTFQDIAGHFMTSLHNAYGSSTEDAQIMKNNDQFSVLLQRHTAYLQRYLALLANQEFFLKEYSNIGGAYPHLYEQSKQLVLSPDNPKEKTYPMIYIELAEEAEKNKSENKPASDL